MALAACGESAAEPPRIHLVDPPGFTQLVPTKTVDVAWWVDLGDTDVETASLGSIRIALAAEFGGVDQTICTGPPPLETDAITCTVPGPQQPFPVPGVYRVTATLDVDGAHDETEWFIARLGVQGVVFTRPAPAARLEVTAGTSTALELDTSTFAPFALSLVLRPENDAAGADVVIHDGSVPGEILPVHRAYPFDGRDTTGAPVPAGDYRLAAIVTDERTGIRYRTEGGAVRISP